MSQEVNTPLEDNLHEEYDDTLLKNGVRGKYVQRLAAICPAHCLPDGRSRQ